MEYNKMSMTLKIFAAMNDFDDLAEAEIAMKKHGFEKEYQQITDKLAPLFIDIGWVGGYESLKLLHDCIPQIPEESLDSEELQNVQHGIDMVHEVIDFMLNKFHARLYPEPKPEPVVLSLESVLRLIDTAFGPDVETKR